MEIKILNKSEIDLQKLAELSYNNMKKNNLLSENITEKIILDNFSERFTNNCYDFVFIVENNGKILGWLALYEMSDTEIAHIWNWHPVIYQTETENKIAVELIKRTFSHLKEKGFAKVTIDFSQVKETNQSDLNKRLEWYSQNGLTGLFEEYYYKKNIIDEKFKISFPDEYSIGKISETDLETLFNCWEEVFTSSNDEYVLSLDAESKRKFFFDSWSKEKHLINEASLTLLYKDKLIGFSRLLPMYESTDGYLAPIGIIPDFRRKGLAEELLKMSMRKLQELNCQTMSFYVSAKNVAAISFYEKLGFKVQNKIASLSGDLI